MGSVYSKGLIFSLLLMVLALCCAWSGAARPQMANVSTDALELHLNESDKDILLSGGVVLRDLGNVSKVSLVGGGSGAAALLGELQELRPTYLAEVIRKMPYRGNEDLRDKVVDILLGLGGSVRIPYINSKGKECSLYRSAEIVSDTGDIGGEREVVVDIVMQPIDMMRTKITVEQFQVTGEREYIRFSASNEDPLRYHNMRVVGARKTLSALLLTNDGNEWTMYAVCGARAIRIPFLEKSIRISFLNRIRGFCDYVVSKLD